MVALQLLVALLLLSTSAGALSIGNIKCLLKWDSICEHLLVAYNDNEDAILDLHDHKYKEDKNRLLKTNRDISNLLKKKVDEKSELLTPLHGILEQEVSALFRLRTSCNAGTEKALTILCEDACYFAALATTELVQAIMEVVEGSKLQEIKKAYEKFEERIHDKTVNYTPSGLAHTLGTEVVRILETEQQN